MEIGEYFLVIVVLLLVISIGSAELSSENYNISTGGVTDGGAGVGSSNYNSSVVVGIISGDIDSDNYTNQLGVFYGLNVAPDDPVVTVNSSSGNNISSDDLLCNANVNDNDGGTFTVESRWYLNGVLNLTINYSLVSNGFFNGTLDSGNTTKHQNWSCSLRLYDGEFYSEWGNSSNLTILNDVPVINLTSPADGSSTTDRTPTFNWTSSDADGDSLTYEINITRQGGTDNCVDVRDNVFLSEEGYTVSPMLQCLYDNGNYYVWKVRANDGEVNGSWSSEWVLNISANVSLLMIVDDVYFGNLAIGESNNTDGTGLDPFEFENDGTVVINVSVNASSLWINSGTDNYMFKAGNVSGEEGSFNWLESITSWFDMPFTGFIVAISELNYSDSNDRAEIDINVTVPEGEDPGVKSSTIVFLMELAE